MRPEPGTRLIEFSALEEPGAKEFSFGEGKQRFELFVLRWQGQLLAYENVCPHARTPLNWRPGAFFTREKSALMCATHGAQFDALTGLCFLGPCKNRSLTRFPVRLDDDGWVVAA
ncbi:Rieske (2Fe-2S) protein [Ferrovibrio sp.]|uniref:Rieske (2Fe-2S) protein n=1 Tax=Ferrovibrio sp. TaxID=1917215 RepID=UPI003D2BE364